MKHYPQPAPGTSHGNSSVGPEVSKYPAATEGEPPEGAMREPNYQGLTIERLMMLADRAMRVPRKNAVIMALYASDGFAWITDLFAETETGGADFAIDCVDFSTMLIEMEERDQWLILRSSSPGSSPNYALITLCGAQVAHSLVLQSMANGGEDLGDVSDHLLRPKRLPAIVLAAQGGAM